MKTFDKKDVFTLVTAEEAIAYIGKRGYFGDSIEELESNINKGCGDNLGEVFPDRYTSIVFRPYACETSYGLFIPTDKIKEIEEEKKYRPFTLDEFNKVIPLGTVFKYRYKSRNGSDNRYVKSIYYHANLDCESGYQAIFFEDCCFNLGYCFEVMELFFNGKWQPFGVEE